MLGFLGLLLAASSGCGQPSYGDAGVDATGPEIENFDLDNTGNARCPGALFHVASYGRATCTRAPQRCATEQSTPTNRVLCTCDGPQGAQGFWSCREERF